MTVTLDSAALSSPKWALDLGKRGDDASRTDAEIASVGAAPLPGLEHVEARVGLDDVVVVPHEVEDGVVVEVHDGPRDLIAAVPLLLGFSPTDSIVMVTFSGFQDRTDLPSEEELDECIAALVRPAVRHRVDRVALVVYSDAGLPALESRLLEAFDRIGVEVITALQVHGSHFRQFGTGSWEQHAASTNPITRQAHFDGHLVVGRTRDELVDHVRPVGAPPTKAASEALARLAELGLDGIVASLNRAVARLERNGWLEALRSCHEGDANTSDVATVLAYASWLSGDGATAWIALDHVTLPTPAADGLSAMLSAAVPPRAWPQ